MARPVVTKVSQATRLIGSCSSMASRIESEIWSAILSGWPSVTDSLVKVQLVTTSPVPVGPIGSTLQPLAASPRHHGVEHRVGNRSLVAERYIMVHAGGVEDHHLVGVALEAGTGHRHVVGDDQIEALALELGPRVGHQVLGFGCEPDERLAGRFRAPEVDEEVVGRLELDVRHLVALL